MAQDEFAIIRDYFKNKITQRDDVIIPSGDDCAVVRVPNDRVLAFSMDTLIEGVHFPKEIPADDLGYRLLAVNLSDMAAMGATPAWVTVALSLPEANHTWLEKFAKGFFELCEQENVQLVGGDLTRGPLAMTAQIQGFVDPKYILTRSGAKVGDHVYVTGCLGDAGAALAVYQQQLTASAEQVAAFNQAWFRPQAQLAASQCIQTKASACIDISDGLLADLSHILEQSGVGATIDVSQLPLSTALQGIDRSQAQHFALSAGDDYQLCFTADPEHHSYICEKIQEIGQQVSHIGQIEADKGLRLLSHNGKVAPISDTGYKHF